MPLSYFPPLPENIWGNLGGNIELQSDLIELIESQSKSNAEKVNLIINPNFSVWQRCSNSLSVVGRSRNTNVATIETALPHGYKAGDVLQIYAMNDSSYDDSSAVVTAVIDDYHFSYNNTGTDETDTTETDGFALLTSRISVSATDDTFIADRWKVLADNTTELIASPSDNGLVLQPKSTGKFGIMQIIPADYCAAFLGSVLSLSADVSSSGSSTARIALLSWTGSKDSPLSDAVLSWNSVGANPSLGANWNYEAISESIELSEDTKTITSENTIISSVGASNLAIFIWFESTATNEIILINNAQIINSEKYITIAPEDYESELASCRRFYQKSYGTKIAPLQISEGGKIILPTSFGVGNGSTLGTIRITAMYKPPTVTLIATSGTPEVGKWRLSTGSNVAVSVTNANENGFAIQNNAGYTVSTTNIAGHYICDAEI